MENVRNTIREKQFSERQSHRESLLNRNRSLDVNASVIISKEDLVKKAKLLKVKSAVTCDLLSSLKHGILQDKDNIKTFLQVDGALHGLIRALSGQNSRFQIHAVHCVCNLSLGDEKQSCHIIKMAGPYLIVHLEGMNPYLIESCAWTIGNLCSGGPNCVKLLKTQGAFSNLVRLLSHEDDNVQTAAVYSLTHFIHNGSNVLESPEFQQILQPMVSLYAVKKNSAFLMFLLSAQPHCQLFLLQHNVHLTSLLHIYTSAQQVDEHTSWHLSILCNLVGETTGEAALRVLSHVSNERATVCNTLHTVVLTLLATRSNNLAKKIFWLIGNLLNHPNLQVQAALMQSKIIEESADLIAQNMVKTFN